MSQENVENFKRANGAFNRRDVNGVLEAVDPEVVWHSAWMGSVYRGHQGVREWIEEVDESLDEINAEFPELRDLGDRLLALGHFRGLGKESRVEIESPVAYLVEFKDGKVSRVQTYLDRDEALEAAGLEE